MQRSSNYLRCCNREIHYMEWGSSNAPPVILWHGVARTCRDFDDLATALADTYRVICPDTIGRGLSQWSPEPDTEYALAFYAQIAQELLDQLGIVQTRWVGTSMGGSVATYAAAHALKGRITHLLLNDNGPELARPAVERIKAYAGNPEQFDTLTEFETYVRTIYKAFGRQTDAQWRHMVETSARRLPNGKITLHYDPAIVRQFTCHPDDYLQWDEYDMLSMPTLVLHGAHSDLILPDTVYAMTQRGPKASVIEIQDCGHAPPLNNPAQIDLVRKFLAQ